MNNLLSYCIPIMSRTVDVKETLHHNISVIEQYENYVDLNIICFDFDDNCELWINRKFRSEIDRGLIKFHRLPILPYWHFSWAKNSFKTLIEGQFYSSLDGDNYLSSDELNRTVDIIENDRNAVIHHFSGVWGDGSSGRVTVPTRYYKKYGYINELMPRQFDEIGLILAILSGEKKVNFYCQAGANLFELSSMCVEFSELNNMGASFRKLGRSNTIAPLRPKSVNYVHEDKKIKLFHDLNQYYTFYKLSSDDFARKKYLDELRLRQVRFLDDDLIEDVLDLIVACVSNRPTMSDSLTVYSVVRNENWILEDWYNHYKNVGVERFFIIDDRSEVPVESVLQYSDVFVFRPRFGDFRSCKAFWLECLIKSFQRLGSWLLVVDSDEFVDVPESTIFNSDFPSFIARREASGFDWGAGILLDMMPIHTNINIDGANFLTEMKWIYKRPVSSSYKYQEIQSVKWAFGDHWDLSFQFDLRWRLFGTVDCLRKYPLLRWTDGVRLHQGFHARMNGLNEVSRDKDMMDSSALLPIRHYKMCRFLSGEFNIDNYVESLSGYFERTKENILKISVDVDSGSLKAWNLTPFKSEYFRDCLINRLTDFGK